MNVRFKLRLARVTLAASVGFVIARLILVSDAFAQEQPPPGQAEIGRVIVTGSNIPTAQEESSLPVTKYTADWLQKSGANATVEGLRQLPSFVGNAPRKMIPMAAAAQRASTCAALDRKTCSS